MKRLIKFTFFFLFCLIVISIHVQDIEKVHITLTVAQTAYDGGNYRTAISKIKEVKQLVGSTTKPTTSYVKIMSYYKLKDYEYD